MTYLFTFIFCFILVYLFYVILVIYRKNGLEKFKTSKQLTYFKEVYKLNLKKLDIKSFARSLALTNAFIIAFTCTVIEVFENIILKLCVGFVILLPLMLIMYKMIGTYYKKKEGK